MRMLDLFCGRWGWSKAFAARGWECVGVDLEARKKSTAMFATIPPELANCVADYAERILAVSERG
jgi:site-specific DNA-cytosine methylase